MPRVRSCKRGRRRSRRTVTKGGMMLRAIRSTKPSATSAPASKTGPARPTITLTNNNILFWLEKSMNYNVDEVFRVRGECAVADYLLQCIADVSVSSRLVGRNKGQITHHPTKKIHPPHKPLTRTSTNGDAAQAYPWGVHDGRR